MTVCFLIFISKRKRTEFYRSNHVFCMVDVLVTEEKAFKSESFGLTRLFFEKSPKLKSVPPPLPMLCTFEILLIKWKNLLKQQFFFFPFCKLIYIYIFFLLGVLLI